MSSHRSSFPIPAHSKVSLCSIHYVLYYVTRISRLILHYTYFISKNKTVYISIHYSKYLREHIVRNVIADLPYMLHFMHAACHVADCLSYIKKSHG